MEIKLKPCPFCGGEARFESKQECWGHGDCPELTFVKCTKCGAQGEKICSYDVGRRNNREIIATLRWNNRDGENIERSKAD